MERPRTAISSKFTRLLDPTIGVLHHSHSSSIPRRAQYWDKKLIVGFLFSPFGNSIIILLFPHFTSVTCIFSYFSSYSNRYTPWVSHLHPHSIFLWFFVEYFVLLARRHFSTYNHNLPDLPSRVSNNSLVPSLLPPTPTPHSTIIY